MVEFRNAKLDKVLKKCIAVMEMPEKWAMDQANKMNIVYPHPIVAREAYRVSGIQYLPHKSYMLPDVLLERLIYWEEVEEAKPRLIKGKAVVTEDNVQRWQDLRMQGKTYKEIAEITGVKIYTVTDKLSKLKAFKEAV